MIISVVILVRSTVMWEMILWAHLGVIILICSTVGGTIHWFWTLVCAKAENEVFIILCLFFMVSVWPAVFSTMTDCDIKLWAKISPSSLSFLCRILLLEHQEKNLKHTEKKRQLHGWSQGFRMTTKCKNGLSEEITIWNKILNKDIGNVHILKLKQQTNHW